MAQKINPTALRLEKTNQHHKSCWYSDYYYSDQLQNNYKICNYIESIFNKIKRCEPSFFIKALAQRNQIFCFFPKKRGKLHQFRRSQTRRGAPYKSQEVSTTTLQAKQNAQCESKVLERALSVESLFYVFCLRKRGATSLLGESADAPLQRGGLTKSYANSTQLALAGASATPFGGCNTTQGLGASVYDSLLQALVFRGCAQLGQRSSGGVGPAAGKKSAHRTQICALINYATFGARGGKQRIKSHPSPEALTIFPLENSGKTNLYPIKVPFVQQSSEFLAQKVCRALAQRMAFGRLRRQILWDVKVSRYVKGVRVSCCGRVESKSKKAQKARTRTFQWGQTELHVFSSLVQFTSKALITPFGKIGVKVWVCYGFN